MALKLSLIGILEQRSWRQIKNYVQTLRLRLPLYELARSGWPRHSVKSQ